MTDDLPDYTNDPIPADEAQGVPEPLTDEEKAADPLREEEES